MNQDIYVFAGPSLPAASRPSHPALVYRAPAAQGDVYSLVASRPFAIGLVDGFFEHVPAVWHKEILFALSQGVHVFGAASMGALRAAELADFGMIGVGSVFQSFADGTLHDDDEVALVHADESAGYRPGSEAMVNIRATLERAEMAGVLSASEREWLTARAKQCFYPDRSYALLIESAQAELPASTSEALSRWLRRVENRRDVKREDALALIDALVEFRSSKPNSQACAWRFQHTDAWEQVRRVLPLRAPFQAVIDSPRIDPDAALPLRSLASLRAARVELARRDGFVPTAADIQSAAAKLLRGWGVRSSSEIKAWLEERQLSSEELERLARDEVFAERAQLLRASNEERDLMDYLRACGARQST